jgi:hypothetical protein
MASGHARSGPLVRSGSIALNDLAASSSAINNIAVSPDGTLACVVGDYVDQRQATAHGTVTLIDLVQKKLRWTRQMAPPEATANVYAVACRFHDDSVFALANADAAHAMANNAGRVYVAKYGRNGDELKYAAVPVSTESRAGIDLLVRDGKLHVIGFGKDTDASKEYYSMFVATADESLAFQTRMMKDGAYTQFAAVHGIGSYWYIGGDFYPKIVPKNDLPIYYANSKIKPGGGYVWSVRPQHKAVTASDNIATAIDDQATTYSLSQSRGMSSLIAVDAGGRIAPAVTYQSAFCKVESLTPAGRGLLAIRQSCAGSGGKRGLVWIDPATGAETALDVLGNTPEFIMADNRNWYGVGLNGRRQEFVFGRLDVDTGLHFVDKHAGVSHDLRIANLKADARGVPSFDYTYRQQGAGCAISLAGKAIAGHAEAGGKVELEVYNPQGSNGKEMPPILALHDGETNFTVARKDMLAPQWITFDTKLDDAARATSCDKKADRIEVMFKR